MLRTPLSAEIVPLPSLSPPCQTAEAFRFISPPIGKISLLIGNSRKIHMRSIALAFALFVFVSGCTRNATTDTTPTAADAKKFMDEVNETTLKLGTESNQAGWVSETFITDDTSALNARSNQRLIDTQSHYAKDAVKFDNVDVHPDTASRHQSLEGVAGDGDSVRSQGRRRTHEDRREPRRRHTAKANGARIPRSPKPAWISIRSPISCANRATRKKLRQVWEGWHTISPPMRPGLRAFRRAVEQRR